jgi:hypothetical protein
MSTTYRRAPDVVWRRVGPEVVVRGPDSDQTHELNLSAAAVWLAIGDGARPDEVASAIATAYGVDRAVVDEDVATCLRSLAVLGLLEEAS